MAQCISRGTPWPAPASCAITSRNRLSLRIPVEYAHFYSSARQAFLKSAQIRFAVVIRNYHFGMKCLDGLSRFLRRHGVGQVHADERHVDILQRAHFWNIFRVSGEINARAAVRENVAV